MSFTLSRLAACAAAALFGAPVFSQNLPDIDFSTIGAIQNLVPGQVEAIVDYYDAEYGSIVRNAHAVGQFSNCTATWVAPYVAISAAHCGGSGFGGLSIEAYRDRTMTNYRQATTIVPCQQFLATGYFSSNADFALWECKPEGLSVSDPDKLTRSDTYPGGVQYGYAVLGSSLVREGTKLYSPWRNPVTNDPVLSTQGRSTLYSAGVVTGTGVKNRWAGPNFIGCEPDEPSQNSIDADIVEMDLYTASGASGSLHFSADTHRAVVGPAATGGSTARTAMSIAATLGQRLPEGDRMIVETYVPRNRPEPDRVPTRFRYLEQDTLIDRDHLANCFDITQMANLALTDRNRDGVYDVITETMAWDWFQPHHFFNFTDPLTRARWRVAGAETEEPTYTSVLNNAVSTPLNPLSNAPIKYTAAENREGALILTEGDRFYLPSRVSNLIEGTHRFTVEFLPTQDSGQFEISSRCGTVSTAAKVLKIPSRRNATSARMLIGTDIELGCDKPELTIKISGGANTVLIRAISVVNKRRDFNFAAIDERDMWTGSKDQHALFTADGDDYRSDGPGQPFFGLNIPAGSAASMRGYALEPGRTYEVRFRAKSMLDRGRPSRLAYGPVSRGSGVVTVSDSWGDYAVRITAPETANRNGALTFFRNGDSPGVTIIGRMSITPL